MDKPVIIFGATGIAKAAMEIFISNSIVVYGFLDDNKELHQKEISNLPVLGNTDDHGFLKLIGQKCEAFVATDDNTLRKKQVEMIKDKRKVQPMNAVHKRAYISESASIGYGNFINGRVHMGADARIGQHCILNTGAILEHGVECGDFVQIGAGSVINSEVKIADGAFIGSGVIIVSGVTIGKNARIGAGSVVISDVGNGETMFGNPAVKMKK